MIRTETVRGSAKAGGFTLMEMMTAVVLLVLVIIAVNIIFKSVGKTVGVSIVTTEMLSNARAAQQQIEADVGSINRNGFMVIRSRFEPGGSGRRFDQICFMATGAYVNRTGNASGGFSDTTTANAALVWYGQLELDGTPAGTTQGQAVGGGDLPWGTADKDFILGRHTTLLLSPPSSGVSSGVMASGANTIAVYNDVSLGTGDVSPGGGESAAHISASRICTAAVTPSLLLQTIMNTIAGHARSSGLQYVRLEADAYCYRFKTLPNVYASELTGNLVNGAIRMHPILLQGVPTFAVEWTDGTTFGDGNSFGNVDPMTGGTGITGSTRWYGLGNPKTGLPGTNYTQPALANNDGYTAIFSFDNKASWPKALRFRYRVAGADDRLNGGRDFVQVVKIPD